MDKIDGWEAEATWVGSRLAACMWICTEAVLCDGQERTLEYLRRRLSSIMESVSWVCDESLEGHEWVSDLTISVQENEHLVALNYETEVPCVVQWGLLWFSSPSRLNQRFANNGTRIAKCNEVINMAISTTFTLSFGGFNTPRTCMLRSVAAVLYRSHMGRELIGWALGEWLVLPPFDDCGTDVSDE